jgi:peptide/nickel transport system permease protein
MTVALRNSFLLGMFTALISRVIAIFVGLTSGYKGGIWDRVLMTINDSLVVIPGLPLLILVGFVMGGNMGIFQLALALGVLKGWPFDARLIRSQVLSLKERPFTNTAVFSGVKDYAITLKEHFPFVLPIVFATTINNILWAIGLEVILSVLGLTDTSRPSIGVSIYWANQHNAMVSGIWWWIAMPITVAVILFVSLYFLSVSLDDYLDPRTRMQRMGKVV